MISDVQSEKIDHNFSGFFKGIIPTYIMLLQDFKLIALILKKI